MSPRRTPGRLRSLRVKLTLLFFAIVSAVFALLYFIVVPELESNLRSQQIEDVARIAERVKPRLDRLTRAPDVTSRQLDRQVRAIADGTDTRLTLYNVQRALGRGSDRIYPYSDSRADDALPSDEVALEALRRGRLAARETRFQGEELGQVAQPLVYDGQVARIAVYSRALDDVASTVAFVRDRLLVAGGVALLLALIGGAVVAQVLARRVRRLERAAEQVAAGRYVEPLPVDSPDELGQLTHAFNEMQVRLRRVDVARRQFVATASHELRTPIFSLGGFVELLADEDLDEEARRDFLAEMAKQVERLQKLAVDLLDLSRLDTGSVALELDVVDLAEVAASVAGEFTPALREHGAELALQLPDDGAPARGDRERIAQILRALLDNAIRHTPPGTPVTVSAGHDAAGAALTIADAGPGVPADAAVFDRFVAGGTSPGAGLGLAIAHELAERMGGTVRVSADRGGAAFTLSLPGVGGGVAGSG